MPPSTNVSSARWGASGGHIRKALAPQVRPLMVPPTVKATSHPCGDSAPGRSRCSPHSPARAAVTNAIRLSHNTAGAAPTVDVIASAKMAPMTALLSVGNSP
jgi:hypothetical protein